MADHRLASPRGFQPVGVNPVSKWSEPIEIEGITLFQLHAPPHLPSASSASTSVSTRTLTELKCPVCLGYIKKSAVVRECLHRFCTDCISKCLRVGIKECPSCRVHIASKRSLRADPAFDTIISGILGDVESVERSEEKEVEDANRIKNMNNGLAQNTMLGIQQQMQQRKKGGNVGPRK
ncbi:hypothetical protein TeGR_g2352 [Tetraparma gracilis]|uniref:RING-type E3 ubiquitin transferase n=1 Tax=Tetraparma gracilis TaxID=2962635 RepID=A0ABQ6MRK5_9STRA|nr:hypothetical protein TeGR_g2352 [Tetraparma gracilis]